MAAAKALKDLQWVNTKEEKQQKSQFITVKNMPTVRLETKQCDSLWTLDY